ncbi:MAG: HAMP domain-containing sensor histidine kinase [Deferrisomatales bacterium]|nr:HAMP domain-containing sensor histidine kinase [Deferrisomatales bacterium]
MTSIRRRILVPLVPLLALALAVTGMGIYVAMRTDVLAGLDRTVGLLARGVDASVDVELGGDLEFELEGHRALEFEEEEGGAFFVVRAADGAVFVSSLASPPELPLPLDSAPRFSDQVVEGRVYRVCTLRVVRAPDDDEGDRQEWLERNPGKPLPERLPQTLWVTAGYRTEDADQTLRFIGVRLLGGFGGLFLASILLTVWIVTRALRPLDRLSSQADQVGPDAPRARLDEAQADREVVAVVSALNRALDRLMAAYERQKRFTADAAHELRSPLTALRAGLEVVLRKPRGSAELLAALQAAHHTALRMGDVVENLLSLSRLQRDQPVADGRPVDLSEVARGAVAVSEPAARAKGVRLEVRLPTPIPTLGDAGLLAECVTNLVDNAVRYTPAGGSVTVSGENGSRPYLAVSDTGVGIPAEHLDQIFERFYRVDKVRSRGNGGVGLGLAIAREIARLHGAELTVESRVGEGSRFELRVKAAEGTGAAGGHARPDRGKGKAEPPPA